MKSRIISILILSLVVCSCVQNNTQDVQTFEEEAIEILRAQTKVSSIQELGVLGLESLIIGILTIAFISGIAYLHHHLSEEKWNALWDMRIRHLPQYFVIVWMFGFCVYLVGTSLVTEDSSIPWSLWILFCQMPMAAIHSFQMFALLSDISAINYEFHSNIVYMFCFSLAHFLAGFISILFIIKYFGYNLVSKFRLSYAIHLKGNVDETYIFWGMNEATYTLAKDIRKTYSLGKISGSYNLIVINTTDDNEDNTDNDHTAIGRLLGFFSLKSEEINQYKDLNCLSINTFNSLANINSPEDKNKFDVLDKKMDMRTLAKLILKTEKKLHIFFLGNNANDNIICTNNIYRDETIDSLIKKSCKVLLYCHARYDSVNRVIEDKFSDNNIEVKVIDSSHESINILRSNKNYHPINFVEIDTDDNIGTVKNGFTSLVLGFGETGRDAVSYLYEYGAFVASSSSKEEDKWKMDETTANQYPVKRSPFNCVVVDSNTKRLNSTFHSNRPAVINIDRWPMDVNSMDFYEQLASICDSLNYVICSFGDDELNITTAVRLLNYLRRTRRTLDNLSIFVRCKNSEHKKYFQDIADHYNNGVQEVDKNRNVKKRDYIILFGFVDQIYTYEQVINNDFIDEGRQYNAMYCKASKDNSNRWVERHKRLLSKKSLDSLSELRRKESQDIANAYHALTKLQIIKKVTEDMDGNTRPEFQAIHDCYENMRFAPAFTRQDGIIMAEGDFTEKEQLLFRNLGRLEHIRWNAAHEMMGYQNFADGDPNKTLVVDESKRHKCNETYKLHNCILDWQQLDTESKCVKTYEADYKLFDFIVITATFMLNGKNKRV